MSFQECISFFSDRLLFNSLLYVRPSLLQMPGVCLLDERTHFCTPAPEKSAPACHSSTQSSILILTTTTKVPKTGALRSFPFSC